MRFSTKAVNAANQVIAIDIDASDEATARDSVRQRGFSVISIERRRRIALPLGGPHAFPTVLFSIELLALLDAGLNVVEALRTLAEKEAQGRNRRTLLALLGSLQRGEPLSQAIRRMPEAFPPLYVATVQSSERTGDLKEALGRYVTYQEELDRVRKKVLAALLYPAILLTVGLLVMLFLLLYVVPRFARVYEDISTQLPFFSELLFAVGRGVDRYGGFVVPALAATLGCTLFAASRPKRRERLAAALWRAPGLGERMKVYQLARLYRTVGMLLRAGVPALTAFDMVPGLLSPGLRASLARARTLLNGGRSISDALTESGLATPVATRMLAVGEKSGRIGELMERVARFHDDETARFVDTFMRAFEPLLMAALGIAVGSVVVLMYMPIFELAGSLQ